jgi:diacylglycerol O-acyltransferase
MAQQDRMRAVDAIWLDSEVPGPTIAIGSAVEVEGSAPTLEELRDFVASRIASMPRLRQRLAPDSLRIKRPVWEDVDADLSHHIQQVETDKPGDDAALESAISQIMEIPLDFDRPLWAMHLVTGLAGDRFVIVTRMHHAVADGQGSLLMLGNLLDVDEEGKTTLTDELTRLGKEASRSRRSAGGSGGSPQDLLVRSFAEGGDRLLRALRKSLDPGEAAEAVAEAGRKAGDQVSSAAEGIRAWASPRRGSLVGGSPGQRRYWRTVQVPLDEVKAVKNAAGCTVNDVVMTLVSGGYGLMMQRRGQDTEGQYLKVVVPVSLRAPGNLASNNQVTALLVQIPVSGSAVERLEWINQHINKVKDSGSAQSLKVIMDMLDVAPAGIQTAAVSINGPFPEWMIDTLVTNVPGPPFTIYSQGKRVRRMLPIVALGRPLWCAVAVVSFDGQMTFGISTGEGGEQAGMDLREGILQTLAELQEARS